MLYVGGGVGGLKGGSALQYKFIAVTQMPVTCTLKGLGLLKLIIRTIWALECTVLKRNFAVQGCDLLIAVGARFDDRVTGKLGTLRRTPA